MESSSSPRVPRLRFDSTEQEVFLNLWRTYDRLREIEERFFADFGLTSQQYNALRVLAAYQPEKIRTLSLAKRLVSRAPDITRLIDRLEKQGWIVRDRPADNRRTVFVGLSAEGKKLLDQVEAPLRECHRQQLGHLTSDQLDTLIELLHAARAPHEEPESRWK